MVENKLEIWLENWEKNWWHKLVAIVALVNFALVLFNLSYIPLRDIYLREIPPLVHLYDPIKTIEPHPDTQRYLQTVEELATTLPQEPLDSTEVSKLFLSLRLQSGDMLTENPFLIADKLRTFAKLKRRMEHHLETTSTKEAFVHFWSEEYFAQVGTENALSFFQAKIQPLMAANYIRSVDEFGQFVDNFWLVDIYFVIFFALEYLGRTFWFAQRHPDLTWGDAMLRRWYDTILLIPTWRWLRLIPISVRLHKSGLVNTERILAQVTHEPAAYLADRVSMFLMVRLINQTQDSVASGALTRSLLETNDDYIQVSNIDKVNAITDRLLQLSIYKVLPQVQPDLEALLQHSLRGAFQESEFYQRMRSIPGIEALPQEVTEQLADYLAKAVYEVLANSYADLEGRKLFDHLSSNFQTALRREIQDESTRRELQGMLVDLLEELKINYVEGSSQQDPEETLAEAEQIRSTLFSSREQGTELN